MGPFRHLDQILGTLTDLLNTSPQIAGVEQLGDVEAITAFAQARSVSEIGRPTDADIAPLHRVRRRFLTVFTTEDEAARIAIINELLASAAIEPRLVEHDGWGLHFHFFSPYISLSEHLNADCAMALAVLVAPANQAGCGYALDRDATGLWSIPRVTGHVLTVTAGRAAIECTPLPIVTASEVRTPRLSWRSGRIRPGELRSASERACWPARRGLRRSARYRRGSGQPTALGGRSPAAR